VLHTDGAERRPVRASLVDRNWLLRRPPRLPNDASSRSTVDALTLESWNQAPGMNSSPGGAPHWEPVRGGTPDPTPLGQPVPTCRGAIRGLVLEVAKVVTVQVRLPRRKPIPHWRTPGPGHAPPGAATGPLCPTQAHKVPYFAKSWVVPAVRLPSGYSADSKNGVTTRARCPSGAQQRCP
jgi:hypothetical protein